MQFPEECKNYEKVIVTRHRNLLEYLKLNNLIEQDVEAMSHVTKEDIQGKHVIGILPYYLAAQCEIFTELPLRIPYDKKHTDLTLNEIGFYMQEPKTYIIREVKE